MLVLKKALTIAMLTASLLAVSPVVHAQASTGFWSRVQSWWDNLVTKYEEYTASRDGGSGYAVPELDPAAAGSVVVLLVGGVAYIASRRRKDEGEA